MNRGLLAASLAGIGISACLLSACKVNQEREVQAYRALLDAGADDAVAVDPQQSTFGVRDIMALTNTRNETLAIEGENYLQALIDRRRAVAAFLPTISLAPSYFWNDGAGAGRSSGSNVSVSGDMTVSPVRDLATVQQRESIAQERQALLLDFQDTLLLDAARTHYQAIRSQRAVEVLENSLAVQQERVNDARARLEAGLVRPLDVSLTESQAAQTATLLVQAQVDAMTARTQLALLTAVPMHDRELIDDMPLPQSLPALDELLMQAHASRQDLVAADRAMTSAAHLVESAYGQYFPSVSLNLQWFVHRDSNPTDLQWSSLIQVSVPLFSAGLIEADVRSALSILRQAKLNYSFTRRAVQRDIEVALANLQASLERIRKIQVQVQSATAALEQAEGLYQVGLATVLERLSAQDALLAAQLDLVNAELDAKIYYLDLRRTAGTLHDVIGLEREPSLPRSDDPGDVNHAVAR